MEDYQKIKQAFEAVQDEDTACSMAKYMKDKFIFYGLPTPKRRTVYHGFLKTEKKKKVVDWHFLDQCMQDDHREFHYLVIDYLRTMQKFLSYDDIPQIKALIQQKEWWDSIDGFNMIIGALAAIEPRMVNLMLAWSLDEDMWLRRIAIDHQLIRKKTTNTDLLKQVIVRNLKQDEFFINKAIGWSLREYSKTNPEWVKELIATYKEDMSMLSIKEASKYL